MHQLGIASREEGGCAGKCHSGLAYAERACEGGVSGKMGGLGWMSFRCSAVDNADWHWLAGKTSAMIRR